MTNADRDPNEGAAWDQAERGEPGQDETITKRMDSRVPPPPDDATVAQAPAALRHETGPRAPSSPPQARAGELDSRYVRGELLGEGGMGEVWLCTDKRIGREVAVKVLRSHAASIPKLRYRFSFEARVQGQLQHPSIVPVYDIGVRADGSEYLIMKRLVGRTLHQVLKDLRAGDPTAKTRFTRRRLLTAFQSVCLAAEFAHQRGVVHRDLKPSNIMLGAYGEVSVLDWGVAKRVRADPPFTPSAAEAAAFDRGSDTEVGEVLGTPGYMSPEQALGEGAVTPQSDIFALGSILFEILTMRRLIPGDTDTEVRVSTLMGDYEPHMSRRSPDVDVTPELDEVCARATAREPGDRLGSAQELHDAVERYLEGESDMRRRRSLSRRHTRAAIAALADARAAKDPSVAKEARSRAMKDVMRALALDGENGTALRTLMELVTYVPEAMSPEAEEEFQAIGAASARKLVGRAAIVYLIVISNVASAILLGVRSWLVLGLASGFLLAAAGVAHFASRRERPDHGWGIPIVALASCGFAMTSGLYGPFVFAPTLVSANVIAVSVGIERRYRLHAILIGVAAVLLPIAAQFFRWVPPLWVFHDGIIEIQPLGVDFAEIPTTLFLAVVSVGLVFLPAVVVGIERDARVAAERRLAQQAHQLAEFLPEQAKGRMAEAPRESVV